MDRITEGRIRGYVTPGEIADFLKKEGYSQIKVSTAKKTIPFSEISGVFAINPHAPNEDACYQTSAKIVFSEGQLSFTLRYFYLSVNTFSQWSYYKELGLAGMVASETTNISIDYQFGTKDLVSMIVSHFGGGWVKADNLGNKPFVRVPGEGYRLVSAQMVADAFGQNLIIAGTDGKEFVLEDGVLLPDSWDVDEKFLKLLK